MANVLADPDVKSLENTPKNFGKTVTY